MQTHLKTHTKKKKEKTYHHAQIVGHVSAKCVETDADE